MLVTTQEAINVIEKYADVPKSNTVKEAYSMALSAIEKQIPKKPIYKLEAHMHYCPNCKYPLPVPYKYCHECGQALDWGNANE